ncbi:G2-specific protein kinase-like protein nimA [Mytilinidion resinicola]|uniref:non-specific serine/threonine protein kinase n=1 Tax=Mytilinidion resinicola TaxID=574789 RepID=A0A6A6YQM6_9PEZI|nr:G2-specific protein kinase-like protein nimA [Mytilinidion resinicola]KAF2810314.1 G2-specific protein kinase-like protein nimA [Mytilinidion resinicola]
MTEDDKYDVLEKIGHGSFGVIRKVRRKADGYILCRKEISYTKMSPKEREQLQAELSILKELRHTNIVAYYEREHLKQSQDLHLYMEYCGNGDLGKVIRILKDKRQMAEEMFVWSIFSQIVSALFRCHYGEDPPEAGHDVMGYGSITVPNSVKPSVLHRDLKPENIFLGADNLVKLGDFGLSKIILANDFASTYVGTPFYMSPEICQSEKYSLKSDIWALGCIVYELCAKEPPFNARTHLELIQKIRGGKVPRLPLCYSADLQKIVDTCLRTNPDLRPTTVDFLNLPIVRVMRKEQEAVLLSQKMRRDREEARQLRNQAQEMLAKRVAETDAIRKNVSDSVRREWEVKARLEIDRQVAVALEKLRQTFEAEVTRRVSEELAKQSSGKTLIVSDIPLPPRSSTPTQLTTKPPLFAPEQHQSGASFSTLGEASDFPSMTDLSSLSLDSPDDTKPKARAARAPLARARTSIAPVPPSPMDIQMADPSPMSIDSLSLSPRKTGKTGVRKNIFAAVTAGERWEPEVPSSPTDEWNGNFDGLDDDDLPVLPSPTRAKSAAGNHDNEDPFKVLANAQRPVIKSNQRLASAPNLFAPNGNGPKVRPQSAVPIVSTSPERRKAKAATVNGSPVRKGQASKLNLAKDSNSNSNSAENGGLKSKKGNEQMRIQAMRNNIQGRTLVELKQARGIQIQAHAVSEDEGKKAIKRTFGSPTKVAQWDPDTCDEMPSPFLRRNNKPMLMR